MARRDPRFKPILSRAAALGCALYIHPGPPPRAVREAYYEGLPSVTAFLLSTSGFGWDSETALHILRLVLSGTLDGHRDLKLIIGHMDELLPMLLKRADENFEAVGVRDAANGVADDSRSGLDHDQRLLRHVRVPSCTDRFRRRSHSVFV